MKSSFSKNLNPLLVEIKLLAEYGRVSKTAHFDTNFTFHVSEVMAIGNFRKYTENFGFLNKFDRL